MQVGLSPAGPGRVAPLLALAEDRGSGRPGGVRRVRDLWVRTARRRAWARGRRDPAPCCRGSSGRDVAGGRRGETKISEGASQGRGVHRRAPSTAQTAERRRGRCESLTGLRPPTPKAPPFGPTGLRASHVPVLSQAQG